jgi:hypothetical protein
MMAALAFEPIMFAALQGESRTVAQPAAPRQDPAVSALVEEVRRLEGAALDHPPLLFRCVEVCGLAMIGGGAGWLVSGLAVLVG